MGEALDDMATERELTREYERTAEMAAKIARLREALETSRIALNDWVVTYASDMCAEKDVKESWVRIGKHGGTLAYIAGVQEANTAALNTQRRERMK